MRDQTFLQCRKNKVMIIIGRKDKIDLPFFGFTNVPAKVDTGAYGCALHCHHIQVKNINNEEVLYFQILDPSHPEYEDKTYSTKQFSVKAVKNSGGLSEERYTIETDIILFNTIHKVRFSLSNRLNMKYPILLGRKLLRGNFIVDVSKKDLSFKQKK